MSAEKEIEKLAATVAKKAVEKDTPLQDQIDALKVLTAYNAMRQKNKTPPDNDEEDGDDFEGFQQKLNAVQEGIDGGSKAVRNSRARGRLSS